MTSASAMKAAGVLVLFTVLTLAYAKKSGDVTELQIGVKFKPQKCDIQAHKGDKIKVHYREKLTDGTVFDSSFERDDPIEFELGTGQVIPGWDQGLLGACVGEKRKLKFPSKLGYGDNGSPPKILDLHGYERYVETFLPGDEMMFLLQLIGFILKFIPYISHI